MTKVWAHRGASAYAPENTIEAFKLAIEQGADGIELDVQFTKDEKLVVVHDEWLDRVSDGEGFVKDFTLKELKELNFNKTHPEYNNAKIATLEEVYELMKTTDMDINVELKTGVFYYDGIEEAVLKLAKKMNMKNHIIYSSFNHKSVVNLKKMSPDEKIGFLFADGFIKIPTYAKQYGADALHPEFFHILHKDFVKKCEKHKLDLNVWTVDKEEYLKIMFENDINAVITNKPDVAMRVRELMQK